MLKPLIAIVLTISFKIYSQNEILYLNEYQQEITSEDFIKKCRTYFYKCFDYSQDTLLIRKVLHRYSFGQLSKEEMNQIRLLLKSDTKINHNTEDFLIVKYRDSILDFPERLKRYKVHVKNHKKEDEKVVHSDYNRKIYDKRIRTWTRKQKKCIKKIQEKHPVNLLYMYRNNSGGVKDYHEFNWISDERNIFRNRFFKIPYNYNLLVIKPNGNYFLSGGHFSDKNLNELLKEKDWNNILNDYNLFKNKYPKSGYGIFKKPNMRYHKTHCF